MNSTYSVINTNIMHGYSNLTTFRTFCDKKEN